MDGWTLIWLLPLVGLIRTWLNGFTANGNLNNSWLVSKNSWKSKMATSNKNPHPEKTLHRQHTKKTPRSQMMPDIVGGGWGRTSGDSRVTNRVNTQPLCSHPGPASFCLLYLQTWTIALILKALLSFVLHIEQNYLLINLIESNSDINMCLWNVVCGRCLAKWTEKFNLKPFRTKTKIFFWECVSCSFTKRLCKAVLSLCPVYITHYTIHCHLFKAF